MADSHASTRSDLVIRPDPSRVVLRPFTPADEADSGRTAGSRIQRIFDRILGLDDAALRVELDRVRAALSGRHRHVDTVLARRFRDIVRRSAFAGAVSDDQAILAGAYFTEEYSFEAVALFNPSIVLHPDQSGLAPGAVRVILSLRSIGEGHISSVSFRVGVLDAGGNLALSPRSRWADTPEIGTAADPASGGMRVTLDYSSCIDLSEVVIFPVTYQQRHGIEDLRLVRFEHDDGRVEYLGTYTAFSGETVAQELLQTGDFRRFELRPLSGVLGAGKGMALFPRPIDGRFAMLGRHDHENIWLLQSGDLYRWDEGEVVIRPRWPWEFIQLGVCSAPIETSEGWLVLTHGVGPIRSYAIGACLLDLANPAKLLARSIEPIIRPSPQNRDGYTPNVVYTCGALLAGERLLLPYGVADSVTAFATLPLKAILAAMS